MESPRDLLDCRDGTSEANRILEFSSSGVGISLEATNGKNQQRTTFDPKSKFSCEFVHNASDYCRVHLQGRTSLVFPPTFCMELKSKCKRKHFQTESRELLPDKVLVVMRNSKSKSRCAFSKPIIRASKKEMNILSSSLTYHDWISLANRIQPLSVNTSIRNESRNVEETENSVLPVVEGQTIGMAALMASIYKRPFDGYRGYNPEGGWWISLEESKMLAMNEEWWTETETSVGAKPVAIPKDNKIWLYESGTMHLGQWKSIQFGKGGKNSVCEVGYGICVAAMSLHRQGSCYVGKFQNGCARGLGRSFWLKNSPIWKRNYLLGSQIKNPVDRAGTPVGGLPYEFVGNFRNNHKHDRYGVATLKDGTKKVGAWVEDVIVGRESSDNPYASISEDGVDWWTHHEDLLAPLDILSPATRRKKPPPAPPKRQSNAKNRTAKRQNVGNQQSVPRILAAAAMMNTTTPSAAHSRRVPVNVTPDSSNAIDLCDSSTNTDSDSALEWNDRVDFNTWQSSLLAVEPQSTPLPENNISNVVTTPENNIRNNTNTTETKTSGDYTAQYNNIGDYTNSINDFNPAPVKSFDVANHVPVHRSREVANDVATVLGRDAIGHNANREEMLAYAKELDALGLHSIPMILRFCQGDHVNEWLWMKPFHKMAFRNWLKSKHAATKTAIAV